MDVSITLVSELPSQRTRVYIVLAAILLSDDPWNQILEHVRVMLLILRIKISKGPLSDSLMYLIVATVKHDGGMRSKPFDHLSHFSRNVEQEVFVPRVVGVREHEILPEHQSRTVAHFVEGIELIVASAPDPEHVEVASDSIID